MFGLLRQDVRYAIRALHRSPLFAIVAVLSIAVGVGATTAIVTLANALLLRPPPGVGHPERVVTVGSTRDGRGFDNFSYPNFVDYRAAAGSLSGLAALRVDPQAVSLAGPGGGEPIQMGAASGNFFSVLEARPALGRFFTMEDDRAPGASPVVVLSHGFWSRRFQADSSIVGKSVVLNGTPFTILGVAAERFQGPFVLAPDVWVPLTASSLLGLPADIFQSRRSVWIIGIGRLAPNVGIGQAQAELSGIAARLAAQYPDENKGHEGLAVAQASLFPGDVRPMVAAFLGLLLAIAGLVLVIASTNVAGMLLARASVRRREIAVRLALGASRGQLVMQLVVESLLVFAAAGAAGLLLAKWMVAALMALVPRLPVPLHVDPQLDWRVLIFALVVSLVTGLVAGVVPALQTTRPDLVPALKSDTGGTATRQRLRLRSGLLVAQIAFSMLLLVVGGLFARTLTRARSIDPGFDARGVYIASLDLGLANLDETSGRRVGATLLERARAIPGVRSAALSTMLPLDGGGLGLGPIKVAGREPPGGQDGGWREDWNVVTPGYFATMGIPLVRGRDFAESDRAGAGDVAILNETFAAALFPGQNAVGRTLTTDDRLVTVIGVAHNAKYRSLGEPRRNFIYVPFAQRYMGRTSLLVKTTPGAETSVASPIRRLVQEVDARLPVLREQTMEEQTATSLFPQRVALYVSGGLGTVALLLALLGIYGVTAFSVSQRTREIGVRVALGAQRSHVVGLVLRQGVVLAVVGVVVGSLAAVGATRLIASLLYGVPPTDVVAFGGAAIALGLAAVVASWVPARRAAKVDPIVALRNE
ncbi:MAG TPA: ABC transporter permease [Gemmatimonadaceae bacterium]|nr:ABC transporter permease [Gemmatimonadaceae bacterium]